MFVKCNRRICSILCWLLIFSSSVSGQFLEQWPVPKWQDSANPRRDTAGNEWGVYQRLTGNAKGWPAYRPMVRNDAGVWVGPKDQYGHPSFTNGDLTGSRNWACTGALIFTPKQPGIFSWYGTVRFQSGGNSTLVDFVKIGPEQDTSLYYAWQGKGTTLDLRTISRLQNIPLEPGERLAVLVTGEEGNFGKADLREVGLGSSTVWLKAESNASKAADQTAVAQRGKICLNGYWDLQWIGDSQYDPYSRKDLFPTPQSPAPPVVIDDKPDKGSWGKILLPDQPPGPDARTHAKFWCRRNIVVPKEWDGRKVEILFQGAGFEIVVYANGKCMGWHRGDATQFAVDITPACRFGQENEILIRVWFNKIYWGQAWVQTLMEAEYGPRTSIWDDFYLTSRSKVSVDNVFCKPSFRKKRLDADVRIENVTDQDQAVTVESAVLDLDGKEVLTLGSQAVDIPQKSKRVITIGKEWVNPKLWMPEHPNLYLLETRIVQNGKRIDARRERFGFVETWIDKDQFRVNGKIIHFFQQSTCFYSGDWTKTYRPAIRSLLKMYKALGYNMIRCFDKPSAAFLEVADEEGMFIKEQNGWIHPNNPLTEEFVKNATQILTEWVERDRNHPCVVMWSSSNEPIAHWESVIWAKKMVQKLDPTRPVDSHRSYGNALYGADGKVKPAPDFDIANTHYPDICLPSFSLLTVAAYPAQWAMDRPKPLFIGEWTEFNSPGLQPLGPGHYEEIASMPKIVFQYYELGFKGIAEYMEDILPYWRRYEVCGENDYIIYFMLPVMGDLVRNKAADLPDPLNIQWDRYDTPGYKFSRYDWKNNSVNPGIIPDLPGYAFADGYRRIAKITSPRFAFFPDKVRAVYGGTSFGRGLCLINDTMTDEEMKGKVVFASSTKTLAEIPFQVFVPQGRVTEIPIRWNLPKVDRRTPVEVKIVLDGPPDKTHTLPLALEIFPDRRLPEFTGVGLYDPKGTTGKAFQKLHIPFTPVTDLTKLSGEVRVLVVGESDLDPKYVEAKSPLLKFVENGGRIVCLAQEQTQPWLPVNLKMEITLGEIHAAWSLADGHPLLAGMMSRDFSWWPNDRGLKLKVPGSIGYRPYAKPAAGRIRSLLECTTYSNLDHSVLLELQHGRGTVLLTQLKIVPVAGVCPPADMILDRLISVPVPAEPVRQVWFAGDDVGRKFLIDKLGLKIKDLSAAADHSWSETDLVVWLPNEKGLDAQMSQQAVLAIKGRASLLAMAPESKLLPRLDAPPIYGRALQYRDRPYVLEIRKPDPNGPEIGSIFMALPDRTQPLLDGISSSEFHHYHGQPDLPQIAFYEIEPQNGWLPLAKPGLVARRSQGDSRQVILTLTRQTDGRFHKNTERILHALLVNLGAPCSDPSLQEIPRGNFFSVDLRKYCTMGLADDVEGNGKGGWSDQGPTNDLGNLPAGRQVLGGVPFDIIKAETNGGKACIMLGSDTRVKTLPRRVDKIDFGHRRAKRIYFLHAHAYGGPAEVGEYRVHYVNTITVDERIPLISGKNISDWWGARDIPEATVVWRQLNGLSPVGLYMYVWKNPSPEIPIESIDFISKGEGPMLGLVAVTGQE